MMHLVVLLLILAFEVGALTMNVLWEVLAMNIIKPQRELTSHEISKLPIDELMKYQKERINITKVKKRFYENNIIIFTLSLIAMLINIIL